MKSVGDPGLNQAKQRWDIGTVPRA